MLQQRELAVASKSSRLHAGVGVFSLAGMELRAAIRGGAFRFLVLIAAIVGWAVGGAPGRGAALSAWLTSEAGWRYFGFVVIAWMSLIAVQDIASRTDVLIYSKPQPTERIVLSRFYSALAQVLIALASMFVFAALSRVYSGGSLLGGAVYLQRWLATACVVFFAASAGYTLALLARSPLAGAVIGIYWILAMAGRTYLPKALFPTYVQNLPAYVLLGVFLLCVACLFYRVRRRGRTSPSWWLWPMSVASLAGCGIAVVNGVTTEHDPLMRTEPALEMMMTQSASTGDIAPGFRLPNANGSLSSLADYPGRILVIALWSPDDGESTLILDRLERVWQEFGSRGVQPIAICLSQDRAAAAAFARGAQLHYPVVHDWGTHNAEKISESSPIASAYEANMLPHVAITDRRRILRETITGVDAYEGAFLDSAIKDRLAAEPE